MQRCVENLVLKVPKNCSSPKNCYRTSEIFKVETAQQAGNACYTQCYPVFIVSSQ